MRQPKPLLRTLLRARAEWFEDRVVARAEQNGYGHLTPAMVRLLGYLGGRPIGLSELARRMAISRQAVHQVATEAVRLGLVEMVASERDGRVKLLQFTQRGWEMSDAAVRELRRMEAEVAALIGDKNLETLRRLLAKSWPEDEGADPPA